MTYDRLHKLADHDDIVFRDQGAAWPPSHEKRFRDIQVLGNNKFRAWLENDDMRPIQESWRQSVLGRAKQLHDKACDLARHSQPKESGWRLNLETLVFSLDTVGAAW